MDEDEEERGISAAVDVASVIGLAAEPSLPAASSSRPGTVVPGGVDETEREVDSPGNDAMEGEMTGGR